MKSIYLYFPVKDKQDIFHIGVAVSDKPEGSFKAEPEPIKESFSIDPAVFHDDDGSYFIYFGEILGGQLQRWRIGKYDVNGQEPDDDEFALCPKVVLMSSDLFQFAKQLRDLVIIDSYGKALKAYDHNRRFFEASWMHKYRGEYYFSYSTGNTHLLCYAISDNPYGPFTYQGVIMTPVVSWTTHHSICEFMGKWYLFHNDSKVSGGKTWLRSMKVIELKTVKILKLKPLMVMRMSNYYSDRFYFMI